jgi:hypothetical protein
MDAKQLAKLKISTAEEMCKKVDIAHDKAITSLGSLVGMNGYGIFFDRYEIRSKLQGAQHHIAEALKTLEAIDWPTDTDYDQM